MVPKNDILGTWRSFKNISETGLEVSNTKDELTFYSDGTGKYHRIGALLFATHKFTWSVDSMRPGYMLYGLGGSGHRNFAMIDAGTLCVVMSDIHGTLYRRA